MMPVTRTLQELGSGHPQNIKLLAEKNGGTETICLVYIREDNFTNHIHLCNNIYDTGG